MRSLVILPTYNELINIKKVIEKVIHLREDIDILIIDDNSPDGTGFLAQELADSYKKRIFLIRRKGKLGLGSAYIEGFRFALLHNYDYIFEMDADLSHDPEEIPNFLKATEDADIVIGSRYFDGIRIMNWPLDRLILSYRANMYARWMTGLKLSDCTSGYKCFSRRVLKTLPLDKIVSNGYGFQIEVNFWCQRLGFKIKEMPVVFTERKFGSSKMSRQIVKEAFILGIRLFLWRIFNPLRRNPHSKALV